MQKKAKATDENHFLFHHKELGHPLIIVNHAINLSVAQMNTALGMRQSLLACCVSLTQFILLFTQDHSYVKLRLFLIHTLACFSPSNPHAHLHKLLMWKSYGVNVCGQNISARGCSIIITCLFPTENAAFSELLGN